MFEHFSLKRRVAELEEAFGKLQRKQSALDLEWQNTLDKLNQIVGRINKRSALISQEKEDALMGKETQDLVPESAVPLSPRARLIQEQVLSRRRALKERTNGGG
jgi:hypothetical protein